MVFDVIDSLTHFLTLKEIVNIIHEKNYCSKFKSAAGKFRRNKFFVNKVVMLT